MNAMILLAADCWQSLIAAATASPFSVAAGVLMFCGLFPYVWAVWRDRHKEGGVKPIKATWAIWIGLDYLVLAGMYAKGAVNGQIIGAVIGGTITLVVVLCYGLRGWRVIDKICLAGAICAVILWKGIFHDPIWGIVVALGATFAGAIPTFTSAWEDPTRENKPAWIILWLSCVCAVKAIPAWTWEDAAQPIVFFAIETIVVLILFVRPRMLVGRENYDEKKLS